MKYGYFDDEKKEYVIETPRTPLPWINYLGSKDFFSLISNTSGGYAFYKDAKLLRLTRYRYNNCPLDQGGTVLLEPVFISGKSLAQPTFPAYEYKFLLSTYSVRSGDPRLDRTVNIWNPYQCMVTFNMSRSASYYESGLGRGMGFRDSCQDLLGFVHLIPERARERILDIAGTQFQDGSAYHQYQPLTKQGNSDIGSGFNDDPLWLIACTYAYIAETGDYGILNEPCAFDCKSELAEPLLEHLRRSFQYTVTHKGPHGLPLIGRTD